MYGIKVDFYSTIDDDPEEIIIGDITTGHNEAFTDVTLPAPASYKLHEARVRVKVDTEAGGNILPLQLFRQMYPDQVNKHGIPTGLTPTSTWLFDYNGTRIPQHGALDTCTRWKPHNLRPWCLRTRWYIVGTEQPTILGLPALQKLGVVAMNCVVYFGPTHSLHQQEDRDSAISTHKRLSMIQNTADLQQHSPDHFEGIGYFTGKYHITLKPNAKPVIQPPRKCLIAMKSHVQAELEHHKCLEVIHKVDEPTDWVSSLAYA